MAKRTRRIPPKAALTKEVVVEEKVEPPTEEVVEDVPVPAAEQRVDPMPEADPATTPEGPVPTPSPRAYDIASGAYDLDLEVLERAKSPTSERYYPQLVIYDKETKERVAVVSLPDFRALACEFADFQMVFNQKLAESARLTKAKRLRKDLGDLNPTSGIRPYRLIAEGKSGLMERYKARHRALAAKERPPQEEEAKKALIERHEKAFIKLPYDLLDMGFPGIDDPSSLSVDERLAITRDRDMEELLMIVRQMESQLRIQEKFGKKKEETDNGNQRRRVY